MSGVIGLDLSLTGTGVAVATATWRFQTELKDGDTISRVRKLRTLVLEVVEEHRPNLAVIEAPSFGSTGGQQHERGYLWWRIAEALTDAGVSQRRTVAPSQIKKYATGNGSQRKGEAKDRVLIAAVRRFDWFDGNNDEADALWACAMGYDLLGEPLVQMPALNREALDAWLNPGVKRPRKRATPKVA